MKRGRFFSPLATAFFIAGAIVPEQAAATNTTRALVSSASQGFHGPIARSLIYVANSPTNSITAYLSTATGNARPVLTIEGPRTRLDGPVGLTFDAEGRLYVVNHGSSSSVTVYAPFAYGNVPPLRVLAGGRTHLRDIATPADFPTGAIAVDLAHDRMFVARISPEQAPLGNVVLVFRATATGNESPLGSIGPMDSPSLTGEAAETSPGIAFEGDHELAISENFNACCHGGDG